MPRSKEKINTKHNNTLENERKKLYITSIVLTYAALNEYPIYPGHSAIQNQDQLTCVLILDGHNRPTPAPAYRQEKRVKPISDYGVGGEDGGDDYLYDDSSPFFLRSTTAAPPEDDETKLTAVNLQILRNEAASRLG